MAWEPNAVDASLIATVAALLGVLVTNQAKVSEFRQKWIDALREDASTLITHTFFVHGVKLRDEKDVDLSESYIQLNQVSARIRLRLNPTEKESQAIVAAMVKLTNAGHHVSQVLNVAQYEKEFETAVQVVLRKEWKRVKWGEPLYRSVFVLAIVAVLLSLLAFMHQDFGWHIHFIPGLN